MIDYTHPALPMIPTWLRMTYPRYRGFLADKPLDPHFSITSALCDGEPCGLCVAETDARGSVAEIRSIFVPRPFRGRGIGSGLLRHAAGELARRGCAEVSAVFTDENKDAFARLRSMLGSQGWTTPGKRQLLFRFDLHGYDADLPWLKAFRLRPGLAVSLWKDVTQEEKLALAESDRRTGWIAADLRPGSYEQGFEPINSLCLRHRGEIVGWMINHRVAPGTIRFTCSFVREDLQRAGCILALYSLALRLQMEAGLMQVTWAVPYTHPRMIDFSMRRFATAHATYYSSYDSSLLLASHGEKGTAAEPREGR